MVSFQFFEELVVVVDHQRCTYEALNRSNRYNFVNPSLFVEQPPLRIHRVQFGLFAPETRMKPPAVEQAIREQNGELAELAHLDAFFTHFKGIVERVVFQARGPRIIGLGTRLTVEGMHGAPHLSAAEQRNGTVLGMVHLKWGFVSKDQFLFFRVV